MENGLTVSRDFEAFNEGRPRSAAPTGMRQRVCSLVRA